MESGEYVYQPALKELTFATAADELRHRFPDRQIKTEWTPFVSRAATLEIAGRLRGLGVDVEQFSGEAAELELYLNQANYAERYPLYYEANRKEKSFEHFVALHLLKPSPPAAFIDVASEGSPLPEIVNRLCGCEAFAQDIMYPEGVHGARIGGDACAMPVEDGFAGSVALTCSLEHFEGDADTRLFLELARVIRPGGRVVVVPVYLFTSAAIQTDPRYSVSVDMKFDDGVPLYCAEGWGNRHGRFYSPESLRDRLLEPLRDQFAFRVLEIGAPFVTDYDDTSIYARFALLAERL